MLGHQFMVDQITEGMAAYIPNGEHQLVRLFVTPRATQFTRTARLVVATENRLIVCRAQTSVVPVAGELEFTALLADVTISVEYRALWDRLELSCADGTRVRGSLASNGVPRLNGSSFISLRRGSLRQRSVPHQRSP